MIPVLAAFLAVSCGNEEGSQREITQGLRFCESTYPYNGGMLIANFGGEVLNPLNTDGQGYIAYYKNGVVTPLIPADGNLNAPKGMYERAGRLFICDVNKLVVYRLDSLGKVPQTIRFPEGELFVNDLVANGNTLYVSVTNTGKIFSVDISNPDSLQQVMPQVWCEVPGANGMVIQGGAMYIASYPPDGVTSEKNAIYRIADIGNPVAEKFFTTPGQYDGIAFSPDGNTLYVSNWSPASVSAIKIAEQKAATVISRGELAGPADFTVLGDSLFIPDLPNSRVIVMPHKGL